MTRQEMERLQACVDGRTAQLSLRELVKTSATLEIARHNHELCERRRHPTPFGYLFDGY